VDALRQWVDGVTEQRGQYSRGIDNCLTGLVPRHWSAHRGPAGHVRIV